MVAELNSHAAPVDETATMTSAADVLTERLTPGPTRTRRPQPRPTLNDVWMVLALAGPALVALNASLASIDLTYHLRLGEMIRATGSIPRADSFTFSAPGEPWLDQQWLAQLGLHLVHRLGGFEALVVIRALAVTSISGCVYATCRSRGAGQRVSALATIGGFVVAMPYLSLRPQLLGAACFAIAMFLVVSRHEGIGRLFLVPLLTLVWANVHGSFVFAPALVTFALIADLVSKDPRWRRCLLVLALTISATCVTPWGAGAWGYALMIVSNDTIRSLVTEWVPPSLATPSGAIFLASLITMIVWLGRRTRAVAVLDLAWIAAFALLALTAHRNILWWGIAAAPILAGWQSEHATATKTTRGSRALNVATLGIIGVALVATLPWWRSPSSLVSDIPSPTLMAALNGSAEQGSALLVHQPWAS